MKRESAVRTGPVDWAEIHRRVDAVGIKLAEKAADMSPEEAMTLLEERARALARPVIATAARDELELVSFTLAGETYAVESRYVIQVFRLQELAPLPGAESPVCGVTAWRGDLLTILDLRPGLGLPVTALNELGRVIVLGQARPEVGVLADSVQELLSVPASELSGLPQEQGRRREYLCGITTRAVLVLDGSRLLSLAEPESTERSRP